MAASEDVCDLRVGIVGGGIGGSALAVALQKLNFSKVTLYEKDQSFGCRRQGYGLTIQQGAKALSFLGLLDVVAALDTPSDSHYLFNDKGEVMAV